MRSARQTGWADPLPGGRVVDCCKPSHIVVSRLSACRKYLGAQKNLKTRQDVCIHIISYNHSYNIVELRTPAMPVGVGGGKERGGFHLNLRT